MALMTFIFLFITLLVYTLTSENKQKAMLISLSLMASYFAYITNFFTTFVLLKHDGAMPASATLLLIVLVVTLSLYIFFSKKKKRAWLISLGIITAYHFYVSCSCGLDRRDIKVMESMAKTISEYILKKGIPKSLGDIPNLPYKLNGCQREKYYESETGKRVSKDEAYKYVQITDCKTTRNISVHFRIANYFKGDEYIEANSTYISIDCKSPNRTYYEIGLNKESNKTDFYVDTVRVYKYPDSYNMICSSMRQ